MPYVLLIEDNLENADMMIRLLSTIECEVKHSVKGLIGVTIARQRRPDLILLDFNLPDIDGRNLILVLKKTHPTTPIIAVTARTGAMEQTIAQRFGADGFLAKPFDPQVFLDLVATVLKQHPSDPKILS